MTDDDRAIGRLEAEAESRIRNEHDLWDAIHQRDETITNLRDRILVLETQKAFAGFIGRIIWTIIGGGVMWVVQHFSVRISP